MSSQLNNALNHVALQRNVMCHRWDLIAGFRDQSNSTSYYLKGEVTSVQDGMSVDIIPIDDTAAQQMMDDLWHGGMRPSEGVASTGQAESMQGEIKHLRSIVTRIVEAEWGDFDATP